MLSPAPILARVHVKFHPAAVPVVWVRALIGATGSVHAQQGYPTLDMSTWEKLIKVSGVKPR